MPLAPPGTPGMYGGKNGWWYGGDDRQADRQAASHSYDDVNKPSLHCLYGHDNIFITEVL